MTKKKRRVRTNELPETEADVVSNPAESDGENSTSAKARSFVARSRTASYASDPDLRGRLPNDILELYECHQWKHAAAIIATDFPDEINDVIAVLRNVKLKKAFMTEPGGGKGQYAQAVDKAFRNRGWSPKRFDTAIVIDKSEVASPTHEVESFKNRIALELKYSVLRPQTEQHGRLIER